MEPEMQSMSAEEFDEMKKAYLEAIPAIDALKQDLKGLNKAQKDRVKQIHAYMRENGIMTADVGGVTFERKKKLR